MLFAELCYQIFEESTACYHVQDCVYAEMENPYEYKSIEYYLFLKNWVDAVQWHLEDVIRDPDIEPVKALEIKRRIDPVSYTHLDVYKSQGGGPASETGCPNERYIGL